MDIPLHQPTIMVVHICSTLLATIMLAVIWSRRRDSLLVSLLFMASALGCLAAIVQMLRGAAPLWVTTGIGLGFAALSLGLFWQALAVFDRRPPNWMAASAGAVVWWLVNLLPIVHDSQVNRTAILALIFAAYCFLSGREVLKARREEPLPSRSIAALLHGIRGVVWFSAAPFALLVEPPYSANGHFANWFVASTLVNSMLVILTIVSVLILAMERAERVHRLASERDPLTNLANRRSFVASAEQALHARVGASTLLLLDIDHFKSINDSFGHAVGDDVLRHFSRAIEDRMQPGWLFARFGGEEFICLLPGVSKATGRAVAEALRIAVTGMNLPSLGGRQITVSIGVAEVDGIARLEPLIARADAALYRAKDDGRNCVRVERFNEGEAGHETALLVSSPVANWQELQAG